MFLNIAPGTIDAPPAEIRAYNTMETFPVLSYPMTNMDGMKTKAELFPPADPAKKYGLHSLGFQYPEPGTCLFLSASLVYILQSHHGLLPVLPQSLYVAANMAFNCHNKT